MPKTIESRSLSAPPSHTTSPKTPNRTQTLPLRHAWRRRWSKSSRLQNSGAPNMQVMLDARMGVESVRITTPSDKQIIVPTSREASEPTSIPSTEQHPPDTHMAEV